MARYLLGVHGKGRRALGRNLFQLLFVRVDHVVYGLVVTLGYGLRHVVVAKKLAHLLGAVLKLGSGLLHRLLKLCVLLLIVGKDGGTRRYGYTGQAAEET